MNRRQRRGIMKAKKRNLGLQPRYTDETSHFELQGKYGLTDIQKKRKNKARRRNEPPRKKARRNKSRALARCREDASVGF